MHTITISNIPPSGKVELPHAAQRLEALPGESFDIAISGAKIHALEITEGDATASGRAITFGNKPGPVNVRIIPNTDGSPLAVRFTVTEHAAFDWIPNRGDASENAKRKRLVLRALCQTPWFDGTKAALMDRSLAEFGA